MSMSIITLTCACCGGEAPALKQWYNQDTGLGLCSPCFTRIKAKGYSPDWLQDTYGVEGVHHSVNTEQDKLGQPRRNLSTELSTGVDNSNQTKGSL